MNEEGFCPGGCPGGFCPFYPLYLISGGILSFVAVHKCWKLWPFNLFPHCPDL